MWRSPAGLVLAVGCLAVGPGVRAAHAQPPVVEITLAAAVGLALRDNASLRARRAEFEAVRAGEITTALRPNPVASYSAEDLRLRGGAGTEPEHNAAIEQAIETGGKRRRRIASAQAATRVSAFELDDLRRQITAQVAKAFTEALVAETSLVLAQEDLKTLDDVLRLQRIRLERGDISQLELQRLEILRFAAERNAADAAQASRAARISLRALVGDTLPEDFTIRGDLGFRDIKLDSDRLLATMLAQRPDLRAAVATIERARADLELARANAWWDITPQLLYKRTGSDQFLGVGLSFPLRIFDRNQGEVARTRAEVDRAAAQAEEAVRQARAELLTALATAATERTKAAVLEQTYLPRAQQARETVEFAYRRGGLSLLDFLDAQRTFRETALEHVRALGNYAAALYQVEAAVGRPLAEPER